MSVTKTLKLLLAGLALAPAALAAQAAVTAVPAVPAGAPSADAPVRAAVAEFVAALNAFDRDRFARTFADDATAFFPGAPFPLRRVEGRAQVIANFGRFFELLRGRGIRQGNIIPRGLAVQLYGDTAIATFHLAGGQDIGRRTLVLRRIGGRWLIVHLHASSLREAAPAATPAPGPGR
jgi:ketosteroid isomerase-like protein